MYRVPFSCEMLSALGLLCQVALMVWAFAAYPWYVALIGLLFFSVVFSFALVYVVPNIGRPGLDVLVAARPVLDVAFIAGTITLWWKFFPL